MRISTVPLVANSVALATILLCYIIATASNHVPYFLPDITHCGLESPERFVFRAGFLPACLMLAAAWHCIEITTSPLTHLSAVEQELLVHQQGRNGKSTTAMLHGMGCKIGQIAAAMLYIGSSVMEKPDETIWSLHIVCASGFFLLSFVANCLFTWSMWNRPNIIQPKSIRFKAICIVLEFVLILANVSVTVMQHASVAEKKSGTSQDFPGGALIEWLLTFSQLAFNFSFVADLRRIEEEFVIDDQDLIERTVFGLQNSLGRTPSYFFGDPKDRRSSIG